ncbi:gamma-glutamyltransferase [Actinorhabdospora filicis]|uniref:gamma-glutamyltransferase n=1 Tax=Actinorhabdospora filicis TaxID=1785913 RepID=UPI002555182B|nr:gamma-glutamyltransferase [Actinorhabdospora filicis]
MGRYGGIAAGHPATVDAGAAVLAAGGSAADAAVAAMFASCVGETVMTGLGGAGFATYVEAATGTVTCLDFFAAVPGLDGGDAGPMHEIDVAFGAVPMRFSIGGASVGVPGLVAGAAELHRRWGRRPWGSLLEPAIGLAERGVPLPEEHATTLPTVAAALLPGDGRVAYAPDGELLRGGQILYHPGLAEALDRIARAGAGDFYTGELGAVMVEAVREGGGRMGPTDLAAYRVLDVPVHRTVFAGRVVYGRDDLNHTLATLAGLPTMTGLDEGDRAVAIADALTGPDPGGPGDTTNISVMDRHGNACVVTTTLGIGSAVWLPGFGVHLNSMLGEGELLRGPLTAGHRMGSMMCPLVAMDNRGVVLAAGSAGASRIRTALTHVLVNHLALGAPLGEALDRPRFHICGSVAHTEPGVSTDVLTALVKAGYEVNEWSVDRHYFGGASAVSPTEAAGDPRRAGAGRVIR